MATVTTTVVQNPPYDKNVALFGSLAAAGLLGVHGVHSCYLGDIGKGVIQYITCGGCCIWSIIDWVNMEQLVNEANAKKGWTGPPAAVTTTTTTTSGVAPVAYPAQAYPPQQPPPQQTAPPAYPAQQAPPPY